MTIAVEPRRSFANAQDDRELRGDAGDKMRNLQQYLRIEKISTRLSGFPNLNINSQVDKFSTFRKSGIEQKF